MTDLPNTADAADAVDLREEFEELCHTLACAKLLRSDVLYFADWMRQQDDEALAYLLVRAQILDFMVKFKRIDLNHPETI